MCELSGHDKVLLIMKVKMVDTVMGTNFLGFISQKGLEMNAECPFPALQIVVKYIEENRDIDEITEEQILEALRNSHAGSSQAPEKPINKEVTPASDIQAVSGSIKEAIANFEKLYQQQ